MLRITVWNENIHEKQMPEMAPLHPNGIHGTVKAILEADEDFTVRTATLDDPECGLTEDVLAETDVLFWWGHASHHEVPDELVEKIHDRVLRGMGLIVLHSGHHSKIFKKLVGTSGNLSWMDGAKERLWCVRPSHPIAAGVSASIELPREEMYGEPFDIPQPDDLIYVGWFNSGHVFRSGLTYHRGHGRIFYFQPGHETDTAYKNPEVQKIIKNAVRWVAPTHMIDALSCPNVSSLEG